jgi:hypothetical protein
MLKTIMQLIEDITFYKNGICEKKIKLKLNVICRHSRPILYLFHLTPSIGFSIDWLLGSKYDGFPVRWAFSE